jgi:transposase
MGIDERALRRKFEALAPALNERTRRLWAATEAQALKRGGIAAVARATGLSRITIRKGIAELESGVTPGEGRVRRRGGGRPPEVVRDPTLAADLKRLVEPVTRGDPENPLRWTSRSLRSLSKELKGLGHTASHRLVRDLLRQEGYSLQANRKTTEGSAHPDRDAQFGYINESVVAYQAAGWPVISVDAKKKELVGDFKNAGREWRPQGDPERVRVHDFLIKELGKASPYGVYDITRNQGWVSVGISSDTAAFAVSSIGRWWRHMGKKAYPKAKTLLVTADGGGSNGARNRLWKLELQKLADRTGLTISVRHLPPGTSKWNKIEHRMFSFISKNWRGRPLLTRATVVSLIAATKTSTGLKIRCQLDKKNYVSGIKVSDAQMAQIKIEHDAFHGEWNYTVRPHRRRTRKTGNKQRRQAATG